MKKLFALVLTLAMVFAIAAPAMAASWGATPVNPGSPYGVKVTLLQYNTDTAGNPYYTTYPSNLGVVANTPVYFQIDFVVPTASELAYYYPDPATAGSLTGTVKATNIKDTVVVAEYKDGAYATPHTVLNDNLSVNTSALISGTTDSVVYTAIVRGVVKTTGDAVVTASLGYTSATALPITKTVGGVAYTFSEPTSNGGTITGNNSTSMAIEASNYLVNGMTLTVGTIPYTVQAGPTFWWVNNGSIVQLTTTSDLGTYAAVLAAYNAYTGMLGFGAGATGIYYTTANILANFGYTNRATASATYRAYNTSLIISDNTTVPNTGDDMSAIGFVMVSLALLAIAAVVVKKVRA
ncbi:MAG TPA: hypothetical protein VN512_09215 [Clostridia bacterium]|nr:hypothetical protein [Clostridia bacterium]